MANFSPFNETCEESFNLTEEPSPLINLPIEMWLHVLSFLRRDDLKNLRLTSKFFDDLSRLPFMQESEISFELTNLQGRPEICCNYENINSIPKKFFEDKVFPVHTVRIYRDIERNPVSLKILEKCLTSRLKVLSIDNFYLFGWLAKKKLPNLESIRLEFGDSHRKIKFGKWRLGQYEKLKYIQLYFTNRKIQEPLNLFKDILDQKYNLKMFRLHFDKNFKTYLEEIGKIYENKGKVKCHEDSVYKSCDYFICSYNA